MGLLDPPESVTTPSPLVGEGWGEGEALRRRGSVGHHFTLTLTLCHQGRGDYLVLLSLSKDVLAGRSTYMAVRPPSMTSSLPVMNDASSEARNSTP